MYPWSSVNELKIIKVSFSPVKSQKTVCKCEKSRAHSVSVI